MERDNPLRQPRHAKPDIQDDSPGLDGGPERTANIEDIVGDGITEALARHTEIDNGTARTIARALAHALGTESRLDHFARTDEGTSEALRDEYLPIYNSEDTPAEIKEWIDWFGTYLIRRENPYTELFGYHRYGRTAISHLLIPTTTQTADGWATIHLRANLDTNQVEQAALRASTLIDEHGAAFRAFLSLRDVDAGDEDVVASFDEFYEGAFRSIDEIARELDEYDDLEEDVQKLQRKYDLGSIIRIDEDALEENLRTNWEIVDDDDTFYVFNR